MSPYTLFRVPQFSKWQTLGTVFMILYSCSRSAVVNSQVLKISNSVSSHICGQHAEFQGSSSIQEPVKQRPEADEEKCGWLKWTKCDEEKTSECPSFTFESCSEESKKGRSAKQQASDYACDIPLKYPGWDFVSPPNKYPSLVAIHRGIGCYYRACWGAIINAEWLVVPQTSGCFAGFTPLQPNDFHIIAGDRILYEDEGTEQERKVAEFVSHPEYKYDDYKHYRANLGLVRLDKPLEFNDHVQPMNLSIVKEIASSSGSPVGNLHVATWFEYSGEVKNTTNQIEFPVEFVPDSECYDKFMEEDGATKESLLCAGKCLVSGNGLDPGPRQGFLFTFKEGSNSVPVPVGIGPIRQYLSGKDGPFGVFTDLSFYIPWIEKTINKQKVKGQGRSGGRKGGKTAGGRLVGSSDAPPHKYPSLVNIVSNISSQCMQHTCGGTLLSPEWILTAGHCIKDIAADKLKVIAGEHDQSKQEESDQEVNVVKVISHEGFDGYTNKDDIGLLQVSPPITLNENVALVKLPDPDFDTKGPAQAVGWGIKDGYFPYILQEVEMPIIPIDECIALFGNETDYLPKADEHICGGSPEETKVLSCAGDSGGPLYILGESGEQIVVGVVSYALGRDECYENRFVGSRVMTAETEIPLSVYTKVAHYLDWIRKNSNIS